MTNNKGDSFPSVHILSITNTLYRRKQGHLFFFNFRVGRYNIVVRTCDSRYESKPGGAYVKILLTSNPRA